MESRYRRYSDYLKSRFSGPVRKISLDAGFTCPNRDGRLSIDGCCFCLPRAFSPALGQGIPLQEQLQTGIDLGKRRSIGQFIAYFQAYTNTYASLDILRATYDTIRGFPEIKILAIGTRPDCVDESVLSLIAEYAQGYEVWVEYGLQSANNPTLQGINRGHDAEAFLKAVELTRRHPGLHICAHVILGLPGETPDHEAHTARILAQLKVEGVKIHPLHVVRGTRLEQLHREQQYIPLTREAYAERVVRFLEHLWPETIIQRLSADCPGDLLIAPLWLRDKSQVLRNIETRLVATDTWQGKLFEG
jgi:radical SAM protein (TIGR01212 family)